MLLLIKFVRDFCLKGIPDLAAMAHPEMKNHLHVLFRDVRNAIRTLMVLNIIQRTVIKRMESKYFIFENDTELFVKPVLWNTLHSYILLNTNSFLVYN